MSYQNLEPLRAPARALKPLDADEALARLLRGCRITGIVSVLSVGQSRARDIRAIGEAAGLVYDPATTRMHAPEALAALRALPSPAAGPGPAAAPAGWQKYAACRREDPELFFSEDPATITAAKVICTRCFVRSDCLRAAIASGDETGVWGGELFIDGRAVREAKPRPEPKRRRKPRPGVTPRDPRRCRNGHLRTLLNTRTDKAGLVCRDCQAARNRRNRRLSKEAA